MHLLVIKSIAFLEFLFINVKYSFIWLHQVLVVACSIFTAACRIFPCGAQASLLVTCSLPSLVQGLSGCPIACGILVPCPGIVPMPPALEGRFLSTGPLGSPTENYWRLFDHIYGFISGVSVALFVFMPISYCYDYYSFVVCF